MKDLSIIVISFNTLELTINTLDAIQKSLALTPSLTYELLIIDNASSDGSQDAIKKYEVKSDKGSITCIYNKDNKGFGAANNQGMKIAQGKYILLLNSDLIADSVDFLDVINYMEAHPKVGVLTVRVELSHRGIDPASHRGFPTPWRSLCYFLKLEDLTRSIPGLNRIFGGYHLTSKSLKTIHEIDSPTGAFYLTRKSLMDEIHGFDESFFMYGEDIDMSYRIKEKGYSVVYYPRYTVLHLKNQSGIKHSHSKNKSKTLHHFYDAMKIFYDKHYASKYPRFITLFIHKAIDIKYWLATR